MIINVVRFIKLILKVWMYCSTLIYIRYNDYIMENHLVNYMQPIDTLTHRNRKLINAYNLPI